MKMLYALPALILIGTQSMAISPSECTGETRCFCMPMLNGEHTCVKTKKTKDQIKQDLLSTL